MLVYFETGVPAHGHQLGHGPHTDPFSDPQVVDFDYDDAVDISLLERQRRLVARSARRLDCDLLRFRAARHWQAFLRLPSEFLNAPPIAGSNEMVQPDPAAVQAALDNFDAVASVDGSC